jgi:hypothetical protein
MKGMEVRKVTTLQQLEQVTPLYDGKYELTDAEFLAALNSLPPGFFAALADIKRHLPPPSAENLATSSPQSRRLPAGSYSSPTAGSELNV